ncbi:hypothetical protein [Aestuariibaculum sediminum]|uniref:Uncharacterized protein n=1 Tax=Aestuariibaculum sediminum TaxID=2770637 RepID=A0A8J6Q887_9FLAO|nr:hypothetical protein [Aestuariibaculum sediminum]MBD0833073.1 hypothetical protein [Aestuariibaculum sediminum]
MNTNHGFKVTLNENVLTHAGIEDKQFIVSCILDSFNRQISPETETNLQVSGLITASQQHVKWVNTPLKLGDKITIEVINKNFNAPETISAPKSEEDILQKKLKTYNKLKEELKNYLNEQS